MITTRTLKNLSVSQTNGEHTITSDVAKALGGDDAGLSPHELLEASLGACTTITVMMYAKRKAIPLKEIVTMVSIVSESGEENEISRTIELIGDLTPEQKVRLREIADRCPMHKFLSKKSRLV